MSLICCKEKSGSFKCYTNTKDAEKRKYVGILYASDENELLETLQELYGNNSRIDFDKESNEYVIFNKYSARIGKINKTRGVTTKMFLDSLKKLSLLIKLENSRNNNNK